MITLVTSVFRRPWYTERQFDAWTRCRGIEKAERFLVAIGASPYLEAQMAAVKRFQRQVLFPVVPQVDDPPSGPHRAIGDIFDRAFGAGAEFVFFTDEDVLPGDDTLEFVSWAKNTFSADPDVLTVSAHSECGQGWDGPYIQDSPEADPSMVRLKHYHNQWGWGTWRDRWEQVIGPEWDWDGRHRGCDWNIHRLLNERGLFAVIPDASRTQHIGYRDGMFSNWETLKFSDAASFREHRAPVQYQVKDGN